MYIYVYINKCSEHKQFITTIKMHAINRTVQQILDD